VFNAPNISVIYHGGLFYWWIDPKETKCTWRRPQTCHKSL